MPQWMKQRREEYARAAQLRLCKKCRAPVLAGYDADICALSVQIDPTPITEIGEAIALMEGRTTYDLTTSRGRKEIHHRAEHNISAPRRGPVYPAHICGRPMTEHAAPMPAPVAAEPAGDRPPY
ncbi:hypothetical protein FZ103_00185 [Streptomonospora sp. PA3]|uniref:hypothetical protein n=1 Tax=Streptomonospora sp. PA3 TaxID=2607326 RepID=UPI0012DF4235|nr:hypothetical protein [Streptomonospora sp. PA3]MUL39612.1 hypothetical protein [Streptomonospora sp. PA3]